MPVRRDVTRAVAFARTTVVEDQVSTTRLAGSTRGEYLEACLPCFIASATGFPMPIRNAILNRKNAVVLNVKKYTS